MPEYSAKEEPQKESEKTESSSIHASPMGRSAMPPEDPLNPDGKGNGQVRQLSSLQASVNQNSGVTQLKQRQEGINQSLNGGMAVDSPRSFAPPQLNLQVSQDKAPIQRSSTRKSGPVMQLMAVNLNVVEEKMNSNNNNLSGNDGIITDIQISGRPTLGLTGGGMGDHLSPFTLREEILKKKLIGISVQKGLSNLAEVAKYVINMGFNKKIAPQPKDKRNSNIKGIDNKSEEKKSSYERRKLRYEELKSKLTKNINSPSKMGVQGTTSLIQRVAADILSLWELSDFSGVKRDLKRKGFKVGSSRNEAGRMAYLREVETQLESNEGPDPKEVLSVVVDLFDLATLSNVLGNGEQMDHFSIKDESQLVNILALNHYNAIKLAFPKVGSYINLQAVKEKFVKEAKGGRTKVANYLRDIQNRKENLNKRDYAQRGNRSTNIITTQENKDPVQPEWNFSQESKNTKPPQKTNNKNKKENSPNSPKQEANGMVQIILDEKSRVADVLFGARPKSPFPKVMGAHSTAWVVHQERLLKRIRGKRVWTAMTVFFQMLKETDKVYRKRLENVKKNGMSEAYLENREYWIRIYSKECTKRFEEGQNSNPGFRLPHLQLMIQSYLNYLNVIWGTTIDNNSGPQDEAGSMKVLRNFEGGDETNNNHKNTKIDSSALKEIIIPAIWNLFDFDNHEDFHFGMKKILLEQHLDFILQAFPMFEDHKEEIWQRLLKLAGLLKQKPKTNKQKNGQKVRRSKRLSSKNNKNNNSVSDESSSEDIEMKSNQRQNNNTNLIIGNKRKRNEVEDYLSQSNTPSDNESSENKYGTKKMFNPNPKRRKMNSEKNSRTESMKPKSIKSESSEE